MSPLSPTPLSELEMKQPERESVKSSPPKPELPHGLVPADQLPSAADALAELFPAAETQARSFAPALPHHRVSTDEIPAEKKALKAGRAAILSASGAPASQGHSDEPATTTLSSRPAETKEQTASCETTQTVAGQTGASADLEVPKTEGWAQKPDGAAEPARDEAVKPRARRARGTPLAWLGGLLRGRHRIAKASRSDGAASRTVAAEPFKARAEASPSQAAPVASAPASAAGTNEAVAKNSHEPEVGIFEEVLKNGGTGAAASLPGPEANSLTLLPPAPPEKLQESAAPAPKAEVRSEPPIELDSEAATFSERLIEEPFSAEAQPPANSPQGLGEETGGALDGGEEVFDTSDDDHAIASAIDRYAHRTARANDISADAGGGQDPVEAQSVEQVDINEVLEIPRDPEPLEPMPAVLISSLLPAAPGDLEGPESAAFAPGPEAPPAAPAPGRELDDNVSDAPSAGAAFRDWSFEEKLAKHHEWLESKGATGKKADLNGVDLEGSDLIGVDLRYVDLHDANLRAADLLMADLRDACLVRTNFRDSCLVGANLEAANLEGASLETAMGLVPRQLAGANLREASLPPSLQQFERLAEFKRASQKVHGLFVTMMSLGALSALLIWMTKDFQLLTNSAVLFFLHSPKAAAALPTVQFYLIAPCALFVLYLVFQFRLQHLWDLVLELPAVFPDGRDLGENEPRIVLGLLRAHFRWMNVDAPSTRLVEKVISIFLAYWVIPVTLLFYWARFLTLQELRGTMLQEILVAGATCVALYSTTRVGKPAERWTLEENLAERIMGKVRDVHPVSAGLVLFAILTFLAAGTMLGVPHSRERAPEYGAASPRRWAPSVLWSFGIDPYADLTEATISTKPANWNGSDEQVSAVKGAQLNGANFRYVQAYRAFLANAHLLHADLQGAFLSQADLRSSDIGQGNLKHAVLDQAQMNHVNLDRAVLDGANLSRADLRAANLSYASLANASLVDTRVDGATLYGARLTSATLIRTSFEKTDLRESHLENADLEHANMQGAYLWSAKLVGARLANAQLGTAILVNADLRNADMRWAQLTGTVLTGADLTGADLDGTDLRGAVGFGASQICAAKSRHGLLLDEAMQLQVTTQCGAGN